MFKKISLCLGLAMMMGCHSNPYNGITGKLSSDPVENKPTTGANFACDLPTIQNLSEATKVDLPLRCRVPHGKPVITIENLPSWATLDPLSNTLTLAPRIGDGIDPQKPTESSIQYLIQVDLMDSSDAKSVKAQTMAIIVHHVPQSLVVTGFDPAARVYEGKTYRSRINITSPDAPNGPFYVSGADLPPGLTLTSVSGNPASFDLTYTPAFTMVKLDTSQRTCYDQDFYLHACNYYTFTLNIVDSRGNSSAQAATWSVLDVRQNPVVVTPSPVSATLPTADFYVQVEDPNGEIPPMVSALQPSTGTVAMTIAASDKGNSVTNPYSMMHAVWSGNLPSAKGTQTLQIKSCVQDDIQSYQQCVTTPVTVNFK